MGYGVWGMGHADVCKTNKQEVTEEGAYGKYALRTYLLHALKSRCDERKTQSLKKGTKHDGCLKTDRNGKKTECIGVCNAISQCAAK